MFDMVVATTTSPVSMPRAFRSRAAISRMASPLITLPSAPASMQRSASPSKVRPRSAPRAFTSRATKSGCSAPHCALMLRPSGACSASVMRGASIAIEPAKKLRRDCRGSAIGAIGHNLQAGEREPGHAIDEELNVIALKGRVVFDWREGVRIGDLRPARREREFPLPWPARPRRGA